MTTLDGKRIVVTGGTGSLGRALIRRFLNGNNGAPERIVVFSRDEAKQHQMRLAFSNLAEATEEIAFPNYEQMLEFRIGDVRDRHSVAAAIRDADVVVHAAALKQVPNGEYFPYEAVRTNIEGVENIVRAIHELALDVEVVVGVSTDKACKPVNAMGMTKAIQERVLVEANIRCPRTRFVCVRYGNVLMSRGSVIPLFLAQAARGETLTVTTPEMTRFLLTLDQAVDSVLATIESARPGETFIPRIPAARVEDVARHLAAPRGLDVVFTGARPGEKTHEILVSEEEVSRTVEAPVPGHLAIRPLLPELAQDGPVIPVLREEFSSSAAMSPEAVREYLDAHLPHEAEEIETDDALI